ncbi:hypothetical protein ABW21_db0208356 [Orbilia brochopaga]|nr:hypothetical protein ABW21_db0208356 [Drechslerella brochopaga]
MHRVRLVINRPDLPQVRILWPLRDKISQNSRYSVYDLLSDVSEVIPLDNWNLGLEDYVAECAKCELLHFMPIGELIRDNDELVIRPLTRTEAKEYLKGGRRQISTTGRKLQDGVPIGRNFITRAPDRPRIEGGQPPAKRQRRTRRSQEADDEESESIDSWGPAVDDVVPRAIEDSPSSSSSSLKRVRFEEEDEEPQIEEASTSLILADSHDNDDDSESDDDDFVPDNSEDEDDDDDTSSDQEEETEKEEWSGIEEPFMTDSLQDAIEKAEGNQASLASRFEETVKSVDSELRKRIPLLKSLARLTKPEDTESETSSSESSSGSDSSEDEPAKDSDSDSASSPGITSSNSESDSDSVPDPDSSSESESDEDESETEPEEVSSKVEKTITESQPPPPATTNSIPFEGTTSTKSRNQRRRESKALAKLIKNQMLPAGSTKEDMRKWKEQGRPQTIVSLPSSEASDRSITTSSAAPQTSENDTKTDGAEKSDKVDGSRQGSNSRSVDENPLYTPMEPLEVTVEQMEITVEVPATSSQPEQPVQSDEVSSSPVGNRRHRPVASDAAKRLILGSLGLRTPRNQAEDEKLRADWKKANSKYAGNKSKGFLDSMAGKEGVHARYDEDGETITEVHEEPKAAETSDPDAWKKQIQLSAVECNPDWYDEDGGDKLPTPPYPYNAQQLRREARERSGTSNNQQKKKKGKKNRNQQLDIAQEENYDDSFYDDDSSMQVDSAQRSAQVERSTQGADGEVHDDDLPPVPTNLSEYPKLKQPVLPGSIVVFSRMVLENYTPIFKQATARVLSVHGSNISLQLAKRDRPKAVYDSMGERVFGGFHMPGMEDDDTENGIEELDIELMLDGRVIEEGVAPAADDEVQLEEEPESERVPETVHSVESESLHQDDDQVQQEPQAEEDEDLPMLEPVEEDEIIPKAADDAISRLSSLVQQSSFQSSSFVEPPFQTNGSCGYGHTDSGDDTDAEPEGVDVQDAAVDSVPSHRPPMRTTSDMTQEDFESSAEAHRFDDAPTQEAEMYGERPPTTSSQLEGTLFQTAPERQSSPRSDPSIQVRRTPDPARLRSPSVESNTSINNNWDLSVDISGLEPAEADKIKKMVKIKEECPEDTELLREALKPFHHPSEITADDDDVNISVDISPPASPKIKRERLSTEDALKSSPTALKDITESSKHNVIDLDAHDDHDFSTGMDMDDDNFAGNTITGSGSGSLGKDQSPSAPPSLATRGFVPSIPFKKSDGAFQRRRKTGALFRRRPSAEPEEQRRHVSAPTIPVTIKQEIVDDDDDFGIPSTMPVRSLSSGKTAFSGRNDWTASKKSTDMIMIDSDDDAPPRASLQMIGGADAPVVPGKPTFSKKMIIKRRHIPRKSESVGPEGSSQWRPVSSQQ